MLLKEPGPFELNPARSKALGHSVIYEYVIYSDYQQKLKTHLLRFIHGFSTAHQHKNQGTPISTKELFTNNNTQCLENL